MISFVISTHNTHYLQELEKSIGETIGIPYEIIAINNSNGKMSIGEAYNQGAKDARYGILCFMHEDVLMLSSGWGTGILQTFENDAEIGLIGVAGSKYKTSFISGWTTGLIELDRVNIYHYESDGTLSHYYRNPLNEQLSRVASLDGVCIFMKKELWLNLRFNEAIKGFHFYDMDISLRVNARKLKVMVTYSLSMIHRSFGKFDDNWFEAAYLYHKHNKLLLPSSIEGIMPGYKNLAKIKLFWLSHLNVGHISTFNRFRLCIDYGLVTVVYFYYNWKATIAKFLVR